MCASVECGEPVAFQAADVAGAERGGVGARKRKGAGRYVKRRHLRMRSFQRQRDGNTTGAGADIENVAAEIGRQAFEHEVNQQLGLGPRNQRGGRAAEVPSVELAVADQVGDGFAGNSPFDECVEAPGRVCGQRFRVTREQPRVGVCGAGVAEDVREQHARFEARQAVVVEGVADRWHGV